MIKTLPLDEALKTLALPALGRNLFFSAAWLSVLEKSYGAKLFVKYIERDGEVASYIIYSKVRNFLEYKICICSYCDYFDCYVQSPEDWQAFFESLRAQYPNYRIAIRSLRDEIVRQNPNFQLLSKEKFHILDIKKDSEALWAGIHISFRAGIRKAERNGVYVKKGNYEDLRDFYRLHMRLRKNKYRLFAQPFKFFHNIWKQYMEHDNGVLLGAYNKDHQMIAATVYLVCGNGFYYKFNTSDQRFLDLRANNLLIWEGIKYAKILKLDFIDFGSSGYEQEGLIRFKDHTGAVSQDINHLGFTPPGYKFSRKIILSTFTKFFTSPWMPDFMTRIGSHIIYHFLS